MRNQYMRFAQLHDPKEGEETDSPVEGQQAGEVEDEVDGSGDLID